MGQGEKLVRTLFGVASYRQPAVIFIGTVVVAMRIARNSHNSTDEIDSLLTARKADENEATRRIKTEFLVQLDGVGSSKSRVLVIGATNRPQELDDAARRRFTKRLYIPLPTTADRQVLLRVLLQSNRHSLSDADISKLSQETSGFSGADLKALSVDAALGPLRQLGMGALQAAETDIPPITYKHFRKAFRGMKPSVAEADLVQYHEWDSLYGSKRVEEDDDTDSD